MRRGPSGRWIGAILGVMLLVAAASAWIVPRGTVAQDETCGGVVEIANGGFESPTVGPNVGQAQTPDNWTGSGPVTILGPSATFSSGSQSLILTGAGAVSQDISQEDLAGSDVVFTVTHRDSGTITFNGVAQTIAGSPNEQTTSYTFVVPANQPLPMTLELHGPGFLVVDAVSGTYTKPCPTPTPTNTPIPSPTPTNTPIPSPTPTNTPLPIPSPTPSPTTEPPAEDVTITVTGDPRFPVVGTAATGEPGLTYSLEHDPDQGSVVVQPDGAFTYTADSAGVTSDQFTVRAADGTLITVNLVLAIDKSVPTSGEVAPGGTGYGGPVEDARNPSNPTSPNPTSAPIDVDDDECGRCN